MCSRDDYLVIVVKVSREVPGVDVEDVRMSVWKVSVGVGGGAGTVRTVSGRAESSHS